MVTYNEILKYCAFLIDPYFSYNYNYLNYV